MSRAGLLAGAAGPAAFVGAWVTGGALRDGYDPVAQTISQLARTGSSDRLLMEAGFVGFGLLLPVYGRELARRGLRGAGLAAVASGLATLGVAALPLSAQGGQRVDTAHALAAGTGYLAQVLAPLLGARHLPRPRLSFSVAAVAAAALVASLALPGLAGLLQRTGLTAVDAWYVLVAVHLLRDHP